MSEPKQHPQPKPKSRSAWYRRARVITGAFVLLGIMAASRLNVPFSPCVFLRLGPVTLACPLGTLEVNLAGHTLIWGLLPGFIIVCALLFILGRMWCGWVCPASLAGNAIGNACAFLLPGPSSAVKSRWRGLAEKISGRFSPGKAQMLGLLFGLLLGALIFGYPFWSIVCPLGVVSRALIEAAVHLRPRLDLLFLLLPVLGMLFFRWGWKCACPVGLLHGLAAAPGRTLLPMADPNAPKPCNECGLCRLVCPAGLYPAKEISTALCTKCLRCIEHCPRGCLKLALRQTAPIDNV